MSKSKKEVRYHLILNEHQARIVNAAVEEYMRIRMYQFEDFADVIASGCYVYDKSDPLNDKKFSEYINRRNELQQTLEDFKRKLFAPYGFPMTRNQEADIAGDIWSTLRHELYKTSGRTDTSSVDSHEPIQIGPEPLPECYYEYGDVQADTLYRYQKWCARCTEKEHCTAACVKLSKENK